MQVLCFCTPTAQSRRSGAEQMHKKNASWAKKQKTLFLHENSQLLVLHTAN